MLVGISLLTLVPGIVGGSETYARELVRALARVGELEYRVFVPTLAADAADGLPRTLVRPYRASRTMPGRVAAMARGAVSRRVRAEIGRPDALHFPLTLTIPPVDVPTVTSVLDVQHLLFPGFFSHAERVYRALAYPASVRRSRLVIAISEHAADTLVERLSVERGHIRVIHLAVDHERFRPGGGEREPFLLYPARPWPHKNHERLFRALALLRRERPELRLVLTGAGVERLRVPEGVEARGRVDADELAGLYRRAAALVFPSLYEGFGQPPLEAMACGCPVAASDAGSLPEVCGDAARLFDPTSADEIAAAVRDVLAEPEGYAAAGLERAAVFTWETCAQRHDEAYREVMRA